MMEWKLPLTIDLNVLSSSRGRGFIQDRVQQHLPLVRFITQQQVMSLDTRTTRICMYIGGK